jgi:hypothetical protein
LKTAPGWGYTLDHAAWLEKVAELVLGAQEKDYAKLAAARGLDK